MMRILQWQTETTITSTSLNTASSRQALGRSWRSDIGDFLARDINRSDVPIITCKICQQSYTFSNMCIPISHLTYTSPHSHVHPYMKLPPTRQHPLEKCSLYIETVNQQNYSYYFSPKQLEKKLIHGTGTPSCDL